MSTVADLDPTALRTQEGRAAWLEARRRGIGSSDAAALVGESPWATPMHVYLEKIGEWSGPSTPAKRAGLRLEEVVADWYMDETGLRPELPSVPIIHHMDYPWMLASLDRKVWTGRETRVLELKTARDSHEWGTPGTDEIPDHYNLQVQHQLAVTGWAVADVAVLFAGQDFRIYTVPRSEKIISTLITVEGDFWGKVQRREMPEPDYKHPRTLELLRRLYGVQEELEVELGGECFRWAQMMLQVEEGIDNLQREKQELKCHLLEAMGPAGLARLPGGLKLLRKLIKRKGYTVEPTEYVRFSVKVPKEES